MSLNKNCSSDTSLNTNLENKVSQKVGITALALCPVQGCVGGHSCVDWLSYLVIPSPLLADIVQIMYKSIKKGITDHSRRTIRIVWWNETKHKKEIIKYIHSFTLSALEWLIMLLSAQIDVAINTWCSMLAIHLTVHAFVE